VFFLKKRHTRGSVLSLKTGQKRKTDKNAGKIELKQAKTTKMSENSLVFLIA
jgi:hypothetical protein